MPPTTAWTTAFLNHTHDLSQRPHASPSESAARLRAMLTSGVFRLTDLRDEPQRFFDAHRLLSRYAIDVGPAFGIRMTVQYNLFAGTILACGTDAQVARLDDFQRRGTLGCFALTEVFAGVHSGLVVHTTATWDDHCGTFVLHTPNAGACKNWISQGLVAEYAVVVADVHVRGTSHGVHGFLVRLRYDDGTLCAGVTATDMGTKTIGNDLDNARLSFDHVRLPREAMLSRYAEVTADGEYTRNTRHPNVRVMDAISQRLHTGRAVIATSALVFAQSLLHRTQRYTDTKPCWTPTNEPLMLSDTPQLHTLYTEAHTLLHHLLSQMNGIEHDLGTYTRRTALVPREVITRCAAAKVKCIETAIALCTRLKQEVGSYALMHGSGFDQLDYLNCCKFAEGDSRVLMQKLARDRVVQWQKGRARGVQPNVDTFEDALENALCETLATAMRRDGYDGWVRAWTTVDALAMLVVERWMGGGGGQARL